MSDIRFNNWKHQSGTGGVGQDAAGKVGIGSTQQTSMLDVGGDVKVSGVVTATAFYGSGANLTGIDATAIQTGTTKVQTNATSIVNQVSGAGIGTFTSSGLNITGVVTATSFSGNGSNLTGISAGALTSIANDASQRVIVSDGDGTATCSNQMVFNGNKLQLLGTNNSRAFEINPGGNAGTIVLDRNGYITTMIRASDGGSNVAGSSGGGSRLHLAKTAINFQTFPYTSNIGDAPTYTTRASIDTSGNFVPGADNTYNLGTASLRWSNLYLNDLQLSNESRKDEGGNDVDGTWGDYTIQEGESDLFLINNRNGKKYQFMLKEVS